ncbi:MAG TPA: HDOD domain-containing protein, partial [Phycisphaerae bacterium]|nr:HDOD domain-containing protein [Phycisphaerae bacterium]
MSDRSSETGVSWSADSRAKLDVSPQLQVFANLVDQWDPEQPENLPAILEQLVSLDPALAASLLGPANMVSAKSVWTVKEAIDALSPARIARDLLAQASIVNELGIEAEKDLRGVWLHCLGVAIAAELLAERTGRCTPAHAYLAGLMHDVGKLALIKHCPKAFARARTLTQSKQHLATMNERKIIGTDHLHLGRSLCRTWHMPKAVCQAAWLHEITADLQPESISNRDTVAIVALAERVL